MLDYPNLHLHNQPLSVNLGYKNHVVHLIILIKEKTIQAVPPAATMYLDVLRNVLVKSKKEKKKKNPSSE